MYWLLRLMHKLTNLLFTKTNLSELMCTDVCLFWHLYIGLFLPLVISIAFFTYLSPWIILEIRSLEYVDQELLT